MPFFVRKPERVEAVQWKGDNAAELQEWTRGQVFCLGMDKDTRNRVPDHIWIKGPGLNLRAGDWVVWHAARGFFVVPNYVFSESYVPTTEAP